MASVTSAVKVAEFILRSPALSKIVVPVASAFSHYAGYRQMGLKFEDIIAEETPAVQAALSRFPTDKSYARNFRIITAHQCALSHHLLPADKQVKAEEDKAELLPYILEAEAEIAEKFELDNIVIQK